MSPSTSRSLDDFRMTALLNFFMEIPDKSWETKNSVNPRWNYTEIEVISHDDGYFWFLGRSDDVIKS